MKRRMLNEVVNMLSVPWIYNETNRDQFRKSLLQYTNTSEMFILTKTNIKPGQTLKAAFSNFSFQIKPNVHRMFPKDQYFVDKTYKSCSIVGNSGLLLNSGCGHQINSADVVIRFNLAKLRGFEKDVGTKVTFVTLNKSQLVVQYNSLKTPEDDKRFMSDVKIYKNILLSAHSTSEHMKTTLKVPLLLKYLAKVYFIHPLHFRAIWNYWKSQRRPKRPSSGLHFTTSAITNCDQVQLYGFWPFEKSPEGKILKFHYHDDQITELNHSSQSLVDRGTVHSFLDEFQALLELHMQGVLKINIHPCKDDDV
ncbi:alpha-2,8-sialyltransferase 8F-like [Ptychodera flava]|uniref:alpha-2,8-sialyltransferase 8F-like n=1 Tax=Ptychodera flava TaxID=63121 RepID=UPI003969C6A6